MHPGCANDVFFLFQRSAWERQPDAPRPGSTGLPEDRKDAERYSSVFSSASGLSHMNITLMVSLLPEMIPEFFPRNRHEQAATHIIA